MDGRAKQRSWDPLAEAVVGNLREIAVRLLNLAGDVPDAPAFSFDVTFQVRSLSQMDSKSIIGW